MTDPKDHQNHLAQAASGSTVPGYVLVPVEPTVEMQQAGTASANRGYDSAASVYKAMLSAAPAVPEGEGMQALLALVGEQAENEALWFQADSITEAYFQQELRRLHAAVEAVHLTSAGDKDRSAGEAEYASWVIGVPAHSKSEYKRRVALGDPSVRLPIGAATGGGEQTNSTKGG